MIILSHRGLWKNLAERNTLRAFTRSFELGFGTETDLRDCNGKIVIAHDIPQGDEPAFEELLQEMRGRNLPLALNIKADGLIDAILSLLEQYQHTNYFTFDMSVPDLVYQLKRGARVFTGYSDILPTPVLLDDATGVWLDCFNSDWYDCAVIDKLISRNKQVCLVSADLHNRDTRGQWQRIKNCNNFLSESLLLCTDYPEKAKEFFYDKD